MCPCGFSKKRIHAPIHAQVANIVGDHPIQPAHAVAASERDLRPKPQVINAAPVAQGLELRLRIAKARRRGRAAILAGAHRAQSLAMNLKCRLPHKLSSINCVSPIAIVRL